MPPLLLGIDVGTTFVKALVTTAAGEVVARAQVAHATRYPRPGWAEQDPADWWKGVCTVCREVTAGRADEIAAIGVSGQGCAVTLIDGRGNVVHPAIIWQDMRAEPQCEFLRAHCQEQILRINGKSPAPYNADPVLMWLRDEMPTLLKRAECSLTTTGYVNFRLTGRQVTNVSDASILFAFDLRKGDWSDDLIQAFGVPRRLYPEVTECDSVIGGLTAGAAAALGLPQGIPVIAGGEDTSSAGLAAGVLAPGQALLSLGTAGTIYVAQSEPLVAPELLTFLHVVKGGYLIGGSMVAIGGAFAWLRRTFADELTFEELLALAGQADATGELPIFVPYLNGELQPVNDGNARGIFLGLSLGTGRPELARAVLEGTAFAIAHNLFFAEALGGKIDELRATGGPTRNRLWCQIIADACNRRVVVADEEHGAPFGNAILAGVGVGLVESLASVTENVPTLRIHEPDPAMHAVLENREQVYRALYPRTRDLLATMRPHYAQFK